MHFHSGVDIAIGLVATAEYTLVAKEGVVVALEAEDGVAVADVRKHVAVLSHKERVMKREPTTTWLRLSCGVLRGHACGTHPVIVVPTKIAFQSVVAILQQNHSAHACRC